MATVCSVFELSLICRIHKQVDSSLRSQSHDMSFDSSPVPLTGHACAQVVHVLPAGALTAYSAFIAALIEAELQELPRGLVHAATKKAEMVSAQEMGLRRAVFKIRSEVGRTAEGASLTTQPPHTPNFAHCESM